MQTLFTLVVIAVPVSMLLRLLEHQLTVHWNAAYYRHGIPFFRHKVLHVDINHVLVNELNQIEHGTLTQRIVRAKAAKNGDVFFYIFRSATLIVGNRPRPLRTRAVICQTGEDLIVVGRVNYGFVGTLLVAFGAIAYLLFSVADPAYSPLGALFIFFAPLVLIYGFELIAERRTLRLVCDSIKRRADELALPDKIFALANSESQMDWRDKAALQKSGTL